MAVSRRDLIAYGTAGTLGMLTGGFADAAQASQSQAGNFSNIEQAPPKNSAPHASESEQSLGVPSTLMPTAPRGFDIRNSLNPRRLTMAMWDQAYLARHMPGGSFEDYDRVLDDTVDRAYNTLRIDPLPQYIDLSKPDKIFSWPDPHEPFMPWGQNTAVKGPLGRWLIEFVEKLQKRPSLHYTLSAWWGGYGSPWIRRPENMLQGAELWAKQLSDWKGRFGFDRLIYVDIANETPYFFPGVMAKLKQITGAGFGDSSRFTPEEIAYLTEEINRPLAMLRKEFPELRFTTSIHGDMRWFDVPLQMDCLDVHFYSDTDPRWTDRTRFDEFIKEGLFRNDSWFREFSDRSMKTFGAMAPMLRARQRFKMAEFSRWAQIHGAPLTTSEAWSSWYYFDSPELNWRWLMDWSAWTVDDAIDMQFWGWTPNNYVQPQFAIWKDLQWHRDLNERFLHS